MARGLLGYQHLPALDGPASHTRPHWAILFPVLVCPCFLISIHSARPLYFPLCFLGCIGNLGVFGISFFLPLFIYSFVYLFICCLSAFWYLSLSIHLFILPMHLPIYLSTYIWISELKFIFLFIYLSSIYFCILGTWKRDELINKCVLSLRNPGS